MVAARDGDQVRASQLAQPLPGRTAVVWPPQFLSAGEPTSRPLATAIVQRLVTELAATGAQLAQALVRPDDGLTAELFELGGFEHAADLLYLAAEVGEGYDEQPQLPFEVESFSFGSERRLAAVIDRTYVGTLDCPRLDGLRETEDVIAGYQAVGQFRSELWLVVRHAGMDVGCLLLNLHPDVQHAEIVYVALVPEVRGRGWGLELTRLALWLARQAAAERVVLAVDSANEPAIRLYKSLGFFEFDRRAVWIQSLTGIPKSL